MNTVTEYDFKIEDFKFNNNIRNKIQEEIPSLYMFPVVYIIYCEDKSIAYIGETTNVIKRVQDHLKNPEKNYLKDIKIIFSPYFNKSSVLHIENNLIQFIGSDDKFKLINKVEGLSNHNYYQQNLYQKTFEKIWKDLQLKKLVNKDILEIQNSDLFKYSPFKALSQSQGDAILEYFKNILNDQGNTTFFEGSAGTGKTILAVYLIKLLITNIHEIDLSENIELLELINLSQKVKDKIKTNDEIKIALVIPMASLRKTLKKVFKSVYGLSAKMVIGPTEVKKEDYDLLIVDEAHRLSQRKNISYMGAFDATNKYYNLDLKEGTQLDWIRKSSKRQIFFYDSNQSVKPSDIPKEKFDVLKQNSTRIQLRTQMRVLGGNDYINFVDKLLMQDTSLVPWNENNYDLKLFSSLKEMINKLEEKEQKHGLCRTISGYSWKWLSKDSDTPDVSIDGVDLYWNKQSSDWINSTSNLTESMYPHNTRL